MKKIISIRKKITKDGERRHTLKVDMGSEPFVKDFTRKVAGFSKKISNTSKN